MVQAEWDAARVVRKLARVRAELDDELRASGPSANSIAPDRDPRQSESADRCKKLKEQRYDLEGRYTQSRLSDSSPHVLHLPVICHCLEGLGILSDKIRELEARLEREIMGAGRVTKNLPT